METASRYGAGRVEEETKQIIRDMTVGAKSALAMHGIIVSDKGETELQRVIAAHVNESVEIEAKVVELIERPPAA